MYNLTMESYIQKVDIYNLTDTIKHYNDGVCFICILKGNVIIEFLTEKSELKTNDLIMIPCDTPYTITPTIPASVLSVSFNYIFFANSFQDDFIKIHCNSSNDQKNEYSTLLTYLARIAISSFSNQKDNRFLIQSHIFNLFHYIKSNFLTQPTTSVFDYLPQKTGEKMKQIHEYLNHFYYLDISLQDLAEVAGYTPPYLANFIKKHTGVTYYEYLNNIRLKVACDYLKHSRESILKISTHCGFSNLQAFQKQFFQKMGMSPENYRFRYEDMSHFIDMSNADPITNAAFATDLILNHIPLGSPQADVIKKTLTYAYTFNATKTTTIIPSWRELINLGNSLNFEDPSFRSHLQFLQEHLHFKYGRIPGILQLIEIYKEDSVLSYSFSKLFRIIDFLLSINISPFLELGNKPFKIYMHQNSNPSFLEYSSAVEYDKFLNQVLPIFIKACANRYGIEEVSNWRFELWQRYNNWMTSVEDAETYMMRFQFFYNTIKSFLPRAEVGGPGFNTVLDIGHFESTVSCLYNSKIKPDFFSFYLFPYIDLKTHADSGGLISILSNDLNLYQKNTQRIHNVLKKYQMDDVKLYATEYSSYISPKNYTNDSTFQGVFIIKQSLDNFRNTDAMGYWLASDSSLEYTTNSDLLFGGNGLLNKDGIKKPSYYAFRFLERLQDKLIGQGDNFIITASSSHSFQVIMYYCGQFTLDYCRNQEKYELLDYPYSAFEDLPAIELNLTLDNIPSGTYKIKQHTLNNEHGNILYEWNKLNHQKNLNLEEINYLKSASIPNLEINQRYFQNSLTISAKLERNEAILFEIDLQI